MHKINTSFYQNSPNFHSKKHYSSYHGNNHNLNNYSYFNNSSKSNNLIDDIKNNPIESLGDRCEKNDTILFEVFGINIYFDDLLIICILFFLYQEGIQDQYLFLSLIMLLLN